MFGYLKNKFYIFKKRFVEKSGISYSANFFNRGNISLGKNISVGRHSVFYPIVSYQDQRFTPRIDVGDNVYIGSYTQLHGIGHLSIAEGVVISDHVYISDVAHGLMPAEGPIMQQPVNSKGEIKLGANCFIGYGASILPGTVLGPWCVVAARAVVTKSFPAYSMVAGNPARLVKMYDPALAAWLPASGGV